MCPIQITPVNINAVIVRTKSSKSGVTGESLGRHTPIIGIKKMVSKTFSMLQEAICRWDLSLGGAAILEDGQLCWVLTDVSGERSFGPQAWILLIL